MTQLTYSEDVTDSGVFIRRVVVGGPLCWLSVNDDLEEEEEEEWKGRGGGGGG